MFKEEKVENQKPYQVLVPTHLLSSAGSNASRIDEFEDPYKEI
jgi:hypothetical protein